MVSSQQYSGVLGIDLYGQLGNGLTQNATVNPVNVL